MASSAPHIASAIQCAEPRRRWDLDESKHRSASDTEKDQRKSHIPDDGERNIDRLRSSFLIQHLLYEPGGIARGFADRERERATNRMRVLREHTPRDDVGSVGKIPREAHRHLTEAGFSSSPESTRVRPALSKTRIEPGTVATASSKRKTTSLGARSMTAPRGGVVLTRLACASAEDGATIARATSAAVISTQRETVSRIRAMTHSFLTRPRRRRAAARLRQTCRIGGPRDP